MNALHLLLFRLLGNISEEIKIRLLFIFRPCLYIILMTLKLTLLLCLIRFVVL